MSKAGLRRSKGPSRHLVVIDGAVDILYNTFVVNWDQERRWVGASMVVWVLLEKEVLYPAS
jgi:hypothetical protein